MQLNALIKWIVLPVGWINALMMRDRVDVYLKFVQLG